MQDFSTAIREIAEDIEEDGVKLEGFISLYTVTRHYGGPEEGGWYYDWYTHQATVMPVNGIDRARIRACVRILNATEQEMRKADRRHQGRYSVLGGEDRVWLFEEQPEQENSTERPHYE